MLTVYAVVELRLFVTIETAAVNLKPLALSLSKGEQAYGLRQAQPERLFQEQRGRLNNDVAGKSAATA